MATEKPTPLTCPECSSANVVRSVRIGKTAETGDIGLSYTKKLLALPLTATEPLVADVCDSCGLVVRLYVQSAGKEWVTRD